MSIGSKYWPDLVCDSKYISNIKATSAMLMYMPSGVIATFDVIIAD